jgi:hypothetical protein
LTVSQWTKACLVKFVKCEANPEMMTVLIRTIETLINSQPTTPLRKYHHE